MHDRIKKKHPSIHVTLGIRITKNMNFQKVAINKLCMKIKQNKNPTVHVTCGVKIKKIMKIVYQ